ncbi:MAG: tRNA glutamyl-Q(34) synthetase GluQRS [Pontibacterium sp.]
MSTVSYVGRFAPSPTGPLHFGSLLAALASFLDARAHNGRWLLRIEDIDPPRDNPEARASFARLLESFELYWDGEIRYQSQRADAYHEALAQLERAKLTYRCTCSRKQIAMRTTSKVYDRYCLKMPPAPDATAAIRLKTEAQFIHFKDLIQGAQQYDLCKHSSDFILLRKDALFSYQLAVVVDDADQGITHIVRGSDLLVPETPRHIALQRALGLASPQYAHIPVITNKEGQKLSKQTFAPALGTEQRLQMLYRALEFLGHPPEQPVLSYTYSELLTWAIDHWQIDKVPATLSQYQPIS